MGACSEIFVNFHIKIGEKNFYITPWQIWHQTSRNEIALELFKFHGYIMTIFVGMFMTVSYLMHTYLVEDVYVRNFTDHPTLETVWTIVPAIILVFIAFPSLRLHYVMDEVMNPFIALKAIGNQWYWRNSLSIIANKKDLNITSWQIWHRTSCNEIALELFKFYGYIMTIFFWMFMTVSFIVYTSLVGNLYVKTLQIIQH